jgi:hypothetical protein
MSVSLEEVAQDLKDMNNNAQALLEKYNNAGTKLDTKTNKLLKSLSTAGQKGLKAIQTLLDSGNVAQAKNTLKLGGKSSQYYEGGSWIKAVCSFNGTGRLDKNESWNIERVTRNSGGVYTFYLSINLGRQFGLAGMANNSDQFFGVEKTGVTNGKSWVKIISNDNDGHVAENLTFSTAIVFFGK